MPLPAVLLKAKSALKKAQTAKNIKNSISEGEEATNTIVGANKKIFILLFLALSPFLFCILVVVVVGQSEKLETMYGAVNSAEASETGGSSSTSPVVDCARGALGVPYVWGGRSYEHGMDCSGLVFVCYQKAFGVYVGETTGDEYKSSYFEHVSSIDQLVAGDLIQPHSGHVVIYTGKETNTIIHEPHTGEVCKEESVSDYPRVKNAYAYLHYKGKRSS